jgi:hypothetical protein
MAWVADHGTAPQQEQLHARLAGDAVFLNLLASCASESQSQKLGDVAIERERVLDWEALEKYFGAEDLRAKVGSFNADQLGSMALHDRELVQLAQRYAGGWRPENPLRN